MHTIKKAYNDVKYIK